MKLANVSRVAFITIVRAEMSRCLRIWRQTLLPPVITTSLYFVVFGHLIGARIGKMQGFQYSHYIGPGLIMLAIIANAYSNVATSLFVARFFRNIEELLASPTPLFVIIAGYVSGGVLRGVVVGLIVAIVALFFTHVHVEHIILTLLTILLSALLFALAGFANALFARNFDETSIIPTFIITPLTYLGGVFYSVHNLPVVWQHLTRLNPIFYIINALRYSMLGCADVGIVRAFMVIGLMILMLLMVDLVLLYRGVGLKE